MAKMKNKLVDTTLAQVLKMNDDEMRRLLQKMMKLGNQRVQRMAKDSIGKHSKLVQDAIKDGKLKKGNPVFSMKKQKAQTQQKTTKSTKTGSGSARSSGQPTKTSTRMSRGEMVTKIKQMKEFLSPARTNNTLRGYKQTVTKTMERLGENRTPTKSEWKAFRQLERDFKGKLPKEYDSTFLQQMVMSLQVDGRRRTFNPLLEEGQRKLDEIYNKINEEESRIMSQEFDRLGEYVPDGEEDLPF